MYKLSVIIPVYNTAAYIERCIHSLMRQTLDDMQYIIIDDGSTDNSLEIIKRVLNDYPHRSKDVLLINHQQNRGIAYTRQNGLNHASGEYIIYCDSDDWVDADLYKMMYYEAKKSNSDIITCQGFFEDKGNVTKFTIPHFADWQSFFLYKKRLILCLVLHMIKLEFLHTNGIRFFEDVDYAEDYGFVFRCYYYSKKNSSYLGNSYYHINRDNNNSLTHCGFILKHLISEEKCLNYLSRFIVDCGYSLEDNYTLLPEKRMVKEGYLLCSPPDYKRWKEAFPEITKVIMKDDKISLPYKTAWWLGQHINHGFMRLYHKMTQLKSDI